MRKPLLVGELRALISHHIRDAGRGRRLGNPLPHDVKLSAPVYSQAMLDEYAQQGMIVEYLKDGELLKDRLDAVRKIVNERLNAPR